MIPSWRWYGPQDPITLRDIHQAGATGIVNALHELKCGDLWTKDAIQARKTLIETNPDTGAPSGLQWIVVESLPIHEDIKRRTGNFRQYIEIYKESLRNLASCGVRCICYNFMPILDWTRTELALPMADGSTVLSCNMDEVALFDIHLLKRYGAEKDYSPEVVERVRQSVEKMSDADKAKVAKSILLGLPGTVDDLTLDEFKDLLATYDGISDTQLRTHLYDFLNEIMPLCEELGMTMAIHPDDPPRAIFGLPRIMSTEADMAQLVREVPSPQSGFTLCTGSLGGRQDNQPHILMEKFADRVFFAHFRNTCFDGVNPDSFRESMSHLCGHTDMVYAMRALLNEEKRRQNSNLPQPFIPVRPDHGKLMDIDLNKGCYAGYSYGGRVIGLTELKTLEFMLKREKLPLTGKVAIVTGAAGVLCSVMAECLLKEGASVVLMGRTYEKLADLAHDLTKKGYADCLPIAADVLDKDALVQARDTILKRWGRIDILVNGAGGNDPRGTSPAEQMTEDTPLDQTFFGMQMEGFDYVNKLNMMGTILPSQVFGQALVESKGCIVNISSMAAIQPLTKVGAYGAAKAAIDNFTQWLAIHLAPMHVRVNAIAPGFFITNQNRFLMMQQDGVTPTPRGQKVLAKTPMHCFGEPEDLLGALKFLISPDAKFVTGIVIPVDGGFSSFSGV